MRVKPETRKQVEAAIIAGAKVLRIALPTSPQYEPGRYVIDVPDWRPATLNELTKRGNHFSAARLKKRDRKVVDDYARHAAIVPQALGKRRVSLVVVRAGRMQETDPDSLWKSLLDALVHAGMLVDDSPSYVELGTVEQPKGEAKATRIILEDIVPGIG